MEGKGGTDKDGETERRERNRQEIRQRKNRIKHKDGETEKRERNRQKIRCKKNV